MPPRRSDDVVAFHTKGHRAVDPVAPRATKKRSSETHPPQLEWIGNTGELLTFARSKPVINAAKVVNPNDMLDLFVIHSDDAGSALWVYAMVSGSFTTSQGDTYSALAGTNVNIMLREMDEPAPQGQVRNFGSLLGQYRGHTAVTTAGAKRGVGVVQRAGRYKACYGVYGDRGPLVLFRGSRAPRPICALLGGVYRPATAIERATGVVLPGDAERAYWHAAILS